jgi:dGTPase
VAQIARTIARALRLNEDLTEAIALSHDLGHPPFGHSGEKVLDTLLEAHGGFEHNLHTLRVVDWIENRYPDFRGLNLTFEVREAIGKHTKRPDHESVREFQTTPFASLEAQVADLADSIAYNSHDLDDGITSEILTWDGLQEVRLFREEEERIPKRDPRWPPNIRKYQIIRRIIDRQVTDLLNETRKNLEDHRIGSVEEVRRAPKKIAGFSPDMERRDQELKDYLRANMYRHYRVIRMEEKAARIVTELVGAYRDRFELLPPQVQRLRGTESQERLICDYVAGMTDRFAMNEHKKLFDPFERV